MDTQFPGDVSYTGRQGQVQVHFVTNLPDIELPEGKRQLLVPTSEQKYSCLTLAIAKKFPITRCKEVWTITDSQF